jgi:hypothetical protein
MKKTNITLSIALAAVFSSSVAFAEAEVSGKIVHESGFFSEAGSTIGDYGVGTFTAGVGASDGGLNAHSKNNAMKRETSARIYIDGEADELSEGATYHVELNLMTDGKGTSNYDSNESYTQRDPLREAYVDSQVGDWSLRTGKQQVVWGTADGMKLLDMINPTDYGEMAQNQMEDSRIPVWMVNAETTSEDGTEYQVIVSQPKENVFAGLNRNVDTGVRQNQAGTGVDLTLNKGTDTGHAFMMKGPDTITGVKNGFLNIVPDLGGVATMFAGGFGGLPELGIYGMSGFKVGGFETMVMGGTNTSMGAQMKANVMLAASGNSGTGSHVTNTDYTAASNAGTYSFELLPDNFQQSIVNTAFALGRISTNTMSSVVASSTMVTAANAMTGAEMLQHGFASQFDSNLADAESASEIMDTAFDYMADTSFFTFDSFVNAGSQYVYNMPTDGEVDLAVRTKRATKNGVNYSLNASYNYDKNPIIDLSWRNSAGNLLHVNKVSMEMNGVNPTGNMKVDNTLTSGYSLTLADTVLAQGATMTHSAYGGRAQGAAAGAILRFTQEVKRVKNLGGSFDMAIETEGLGPVVIRGEALYTKDSYSPIIDKTKLSHGDLVGALEMVKGDRLKYVLGVDITALTNMMISAQYIEDRNLDFVNGTDRYTADYATMSMSNGFNKAIESKNFYSLFFSKPFGASGEHRWNNITMLEESANGNGKWNRLDAEFSIDDDTQATVEFNKYWGNENTQFGQLAASSNIQVGVKYSF